MRKSYYTKIWELQREGKISNEYAQELLEKHQEELEKRRKFIKGEKITSLEELLNETWVICGIRTMHIKAVMNWQMWMVLRAIEEGCFYKAIRKGETE